MAKPAQLQPDHTYIHVSSSLSPQDLSDTLSVSQPEGIKLAYRGPVGELDGEHVFEVEQANKPVKRDSDFWASQGTNVVNFARSVAGVKKAEVLVAKQRVKRDEF